MVVVEDAVEDVAVAVVADVDVCDGDCVSKEECSGTFGLAAYNAQTRSGYKNFCVKPFVCLNEVHQDTGESCKCKRRDNGEVGRKNLCKSCEWGLNGVEYSCTENN